MKNSKILIIGLATLALASCGGSGSKGTTASKSQASAVSNATGTAVQSAVTNALGQARLNPRAATVSGSHTVTDVSVACGAGGTATVSGTVGFTADSSSANDVNVEFTYDVTADFSKCKETGSDKNDYTLDGSLTAKGTGSIKITTSGSTATVDAKFDGTDTGTISVTGTGVSETSCVIDLTSTAKVSGTSPTFTASGSYSGTVCGADAGGDYNISA